MPSVTLTELARMRIEAISFFVVVFLVCAWVVQRLWNALRADFPRLPRLGFWRAVGVVTLWAFLFVLVLTMISGARELMTPGAWRKEGLTYKVREVQDALPPDSEPKSERRHALDRLRVALWTYARSHDDTFPADEASAPEIPEEVWRLPGPSGARYLYKGGQKPGPAAGATPLAFEPAVFGSSRLVLLTSGAVESMLTSELTRRLELGDRR